MRRRLVVLLAASALAGCGPRPAEQADICAIFALAGVPGDTQLGDASDLAWAKAHERALFKSGVIYGPGWQVMGHGRSWGHCPVRPKPVEHLLISPDGTYAMTKGGRRANGRPVSFGACYYEKAATGWRPRACRRTLDEPVPLMTFKPAKKPAP
uniref:Lipoprotein n=1 Tax=Caulobacter sp. (strain K31) TaxID=366602 RepID=B0SWP9_CAUSK